MANLKTNYLGIEIKNPIVAGASNISTKKENLKWLEEAGVAAIVYKSLFEEQIQLETLQLDEELAEYNERHAEMVNIFPDISHAGPKEFLYQLGEAKSSVKIPVIASLNGMYLQTWMEYAKLIEETGVDALELNFYQVPTDFDKSGITIINKQVEIIEALKSRLKIPISVKLDPFYTNPLNVIDKMQEAGSKGFVLFNRLFQPDIDIDTESHVSHFNLSREGDYGNTIRYAGMLYGNIDASIIANTGIYTAKDMIKMILAGADAVQVVSTLYKNKISYVSEMLMDLESWMSKKGYKSINDFKGKLSRKNTKDPFAFKRAQYIDMLLKNADDIMKKYPVR